MLSFFPKYRISARTAETLKANEPVRWEAAEADLRDRSVTIGRRLKTPFNEDQIQRLVALAVLVELGVFSWSARAAEHTVTLIPEASPALAAVGEPIEDAVDRVERIQREADAEAFGG